MKFNAGHRLFDDIRIFDLVTTETNQTIIPNDYIDKKLRA